MTSSYIEVIIPVKEQQKKDMLIAALLTWGFEGFEEQQELLKAFIPACDFKELQVAELIAQHGVEYHKVFVEDKNWNAEWEANFEPVVIDKFCSVRAHFHAPVPGVAFDIIITPKMSFGTGHHATTMLMIKSMSKIDFHNRSVFDFGTGTGVLAILAEKAGASNIVAIDNDAWSIENAAENLKQNNCHKTLLFKGDHVPDGKVFDIIIANISRNVILGNLDNLQQHLAPDGVLLISGLLSSDQLVIMEKASNLPMRLTDSLEKESWICLCFRKG